MTRFNPRCNSDIAIMYAGRFGWLVLPVGWPGCQAKSGEDWFKKPLVKEGFHDASGDPRQIREWWARWPRALPGVASGQISGIGILDVDVHNPAKYGPDSLDALGHKIPETWISHTPSGGWHNWFDPCGKYFPSTTHKLGLGLDTRFDGGYLIAPSPGSGYRWDAHYHPGITALAPAPDWLDPPPPPRTTPAKPVRPAFGLSPYATGAVEGARKAILNAPDGQQRVTLRDEAFSLGTLAGAGAIPAAFAKAALIDAGCAMTSHNPRDPWTLKEIERVVDGCFEVGMQRPRPVANGPGERNHNHRR